MAKRSVISPVYLLPTYFVVGWNLTAVPEPASCLLLALGALAMFVRMGLVRTGLLGAARR